MNKRLCSTLIVLFAITSLILTACGSGSSNKPDVAPFPDATSDTGKYEDIRVKMEEGELRALEGTGTVMEMKAYVTASSVDDVMAYYRDTLSGWTEESMDNGGSDATINKWSQGSQSVVIIYMPDSSGGEENGLFVEEAWVEE